MDLLDHERSSPEPPISMTYDLQTQLPHGSYGDQDRKKKIAAETAFTARVRRSAVFVWEKVSFILQTLIMFVVAIITMILERVSPRYFNTVDAEQGGMTRALRWRNFFRTLIKTRWNTYVKRFLMIIAVICAVVLLKKVMLGSVDHATIERIRRSRAVLQHCAGHGDDLMKVLQTSAIEVTPQDFEKGKLPCGMGIEHLKEKMLIQQREHGHDGHRCLTSKHMGHGYSVISKRNEDESIEFLFNPSNLVAVKKDGISKINVTSDFFPTHEPISRTRPNSAFFSFVDTTNVPKRVKVSGATLHCIMDAWEILSGKHYTLFTEDNEKRED